MNKIKLIILSIMGGCSVLMEIMTPIAIALFWGYFFGLTTMASTLVLVVGGLATLFRAIRIWWEK